MMARFLGGVVALCCAVGAVVGTIAAVSDWIPHGGHQGHAPTTLGYIAR